VADRTGVRRETLEAELKRARPSSYPAPQYTPAPPPGRAAPRVPKLGAERSLLLLMTKNPEFVERASERMGAEDFVDSSCRAIFLALLDDPELRAPPVSMDPVAAQRLEEILSDPEEVAHAGRVFDESVARIRVATLDRRIQDLDQRIKVARDDDEKGPLVIEKGRVVSERNALGPDDWSTTTRKLRDHKT
jgi:hypothetical protein